MNAERASVLQLLAGFLGFLNAFMAAMENAEKSSNLEFYINTHWITTIILFAGASRLLMLNFRISEVFSLMMQLLCLCITFNAVVADLWNLHIISALNVTDAPSPTTIAYVKTYNGIDSFLCMIAFLLAAYIVYCHFYTSTSIYTQPSSAKLLGMGTALVVLGVIRFICYFCEFFNITGQDRLRALFANYTLDEPAWICTQLSLGIICVLSSKGSKLLQDLAFSLAATTLMPSLFYLWLDYRWWASSRLSFGSSSPWSHWQTAAVLISFCNVGVVMATLVELMSMHSMWRRLTMDEKTKNFLISLAASFLILSCATVSLDVYTIWKKHFYRLFHGSEQKTPFLTALTAVFAMAASTSRFASIALPACTCLSLYSLNSTIFQLISYLYLSSNNYFGDQLCELFFPGVARCQLSVSRNEAVIHFVQVLLDFFVMILSSIFCVVSMRISYIVTTTENSNSRMESTIRLLGVLMAACGLAVLVQTLMFFRTSSNLHPMVIVYMALYHLSLAIALTVFPLYQILSAEKLSSKPMIQTTLLIMSVVRFVEILTQLDYRGTGDDLSVAWKVHQTADFLALICHFATAMMVIRLMINRYETDSGDLQLFNNPLTTEFESDYLQFRLQDGY